MTGPRQLGLPRRCVGTNEDLLRPGERLPVLEKDLSRLFPKELGVALNRGPEGFEGLAFGEGELADDLYVLTKTEK